MPLTRALPLLVCAWALASTAHATLEDLYGDTGTHFQGAIGLYSVEPTPGNVGGPPGGYGVAIDDMVIIWKETRLDADTHACAGSGECATLEVKSGLVYDGNALIELTVTDRTPYDPVNPKNDCNGNGSFADAADDQDCDDDGTPDVTVKLTSPSETSGEIAILNRVSVGSPVYRARFPYSTQYNSPGSIYVQRSGTGSAVVTALYDDRDDGTGVRCKNALDPAKRGVLTATSTIAITAGRVALKSYTLTLVGTPGVNGDADDFADANETLDLAVAFTNKSGVDVDDLVATLGTTSPNIACISKPIVAIGSVLNTATVTAPPFRFKVANVNRTSVDQILRATFTLSLRSNKFDMLTRTMEIKLDLDLNATAGGTVSPFVEDFEAATGFGLFTIDTIDANKRSTLLSNGFRCQYNDVVCNVGASYGCPDCFLGFASDPTTGVNDWHVHKNNAANGNVGRAYTGVQSLHYGVHVGTTAKRDTTRLKQLDAIRMTQPVNLPAAAAAPELVFAHQVSLVDDRLITNIQAGEATDRGVVEIQLANTAGAPVGSWIKLTPYENEYDQQGTDDYFNCTFDPTDDGNNEDSYFDPLDPNRRYGPSSTCFPEFVYARSGCTDYRSPASGGTCPVDNSNIGLAFDGPGLKGGGGLADNPGTWVKPRFSLISFANRQVRVRFLITTIELGTTNTWDLAVQRDDLISDDGWYIDDVRIEQALASPVTLTVDTATVTGLSCGACSNVTPAIVATPPTSAGPGGVVTLSARSSAIDVCLGGVPQFQFWREGGDGIVGNGDDVLLRDYTDDAFLLDAPQVNTRYGVRVRCSSDPACDASGNGTFTTVVVACPTTGAAKAKLAQTLHVDKASLAGAEPDQSATVSWGTITSVDVIRGNLAALRASQTTVSCGPSGCDGDGSFTGTVQACIANDQVIASIADDTPAAAPGALLYWLARPTATTYCNEVGISWSAAGAVLEDTIGGRDVQVSADPASCP